MAIHKVDTKFSNSNVVALTQQNALKRQMESIAQNMANMNTTSARSESIVFGAQLLKSSGGREVSFVAEKGVVRDLSQGPIEHTGNDFDVAIKGPGYLSVQTPQGIRYTRNGNLHLDAQRQLVTAQGHPVLNKAQAPIIIPAGSTSTHIDPSGNIIGSGGGLGTFSLSMFENEQALIAKGAGLYETTQTPSPATNARIEQGSLEGSNVNSVIEATKLIDVSRMYEQNQAFMQKTDQKTKDVIEKVGKV